MGCSPWGSEESDTTKRLHFYFSLSCIGEGSGNPLQCSWLENPRDGGAWWAAIYGVTWSRTRLKRLSSSSSSSSRVSGRLWPLQETLQDQQVSLAQFSSVQPLRHVGLFATPWTAACQASLSITNSRSLLKLMSIESVTTIQPSLLPHSLLLPSIFLSIKVFSNESALGMRWPKYCSFSFNISPSNEHPGLISFRMDWLDLLAVQGTLKSLLQHYSAKASILRCSAFFSPTLTSIHDHWKNHSLD